MNSPKRPPQASTPWDLINVGKQAGEGEVDRGSSDATGERERVWAKGLAARRSQGRVTI